MIDQAAMARYFGELRDTYVLVGIAPGADAAAVEQRVKRLVSTRYPSAEALNQEELKKSQEEQIGALVGLVYALLSLAVIVSIFGIVNTLALSIHERTRELGMLRAVGMTRRQVKRVIRYEAVITALIGALLGTALGVLFAALISRPLADEGFELAYPGRAADRDPRARGRWPESSQRSVRRGVRRSSTFSRRWRTSSPACRSIGSALHGDQGIHSRRADRQAARGRQARAGARDLARRERRPGGVGAGPRGLPADRKAAIVGFTGPPGVGKSTLIGGLTTRYRARDRQVAVLSIDPSSPFTKGALLGDRIRLTEHFLDAGVFIRSMANRGALGGLSEACLQAALLMDASGKDVVLLETVGVGQAEVDIIDHADTVVLALMPGSGDSIQALKAGVMEIPDVIVVNKSDHPLTDTMIREIRGVLSLGPQKGWRVPIVKTEASRGEGIDELIDAIESHREYIEGEGTLLERRRRNLMNEVLALAAGRLRRRLEESLHDDESVRELLDEVVARRLDPSSAATKLLEREL